jgi:dTMP kinase
VAKSPIPGGLLVAIEGIDGAGKTTVASGLAEMLRGFGNVVSLSKEPTAGTWGRKLRESATSGRLTLEEELDLFRRDRAEHVAQVIQPALDRDEVVILDRYYYSTAAYQGAAGADPERVLSDNESFAPRPHVMLLLDLPVAEGIARIRARGDVPNRFETSDALLRAREIFLGMGRPEIVVIDAAQSAEAVLSLAWAHVARAAAGVAHAAYGMTPEGGEALLAFGGTR